jgi:hypothetical protein
MDKQGGRGGERVTVRQKDRGITVRLGATMRARTEEEKNAQKQNPVKELKMGTDINSPLLSASPPLFVVPHL